MRPPKAHVSKERSVNTYAELWHASNVLLAKAAADEKGSAWVLLASLTFTAFAFEAYMNHIGRTLFTSWDTLESLPPIGKLDMVCEKLNLSFAASERPRQTVEELFRLRNLLAHGKTVRLVEQSQRDADEHLDKFLGERPLTLWEKLMSDERHAKRAREDTEKIIRQIHEAAKPLDDPLFFTGVGMHHASLVQDS